MTFRTMIVAVALVAVGVAGCKSKDSQFKMKNEPNQANQMNNSQLPPGHPPMDGGQGGQPQGGQPPMGGQAMGQAPGSIPPPPAAPNEGGLDINALEKSMPKGWTKVQPSSGMRLAQYKLPKVGSEPDEAECYVFYLGGNAGTVDANIDRWYNQFGEQKDKNKSKITSSGKLNVTFAEVAGTMGASSMSGQNADKPNFRMFAGIVETQAGPYFFKAVGPDKTIKAQRDAIKSWLAKATAADAHAIEMH